MHLLAVFLIMNYQCRVRNRSKLVHDIQCVPQLPETIILEYSSESYQELATPKLESVVNFGKAIEILTEYFLLTMNTLLAHRHICPLLNQTLHVNRTASS